MEKQRIEAVFFDCWDTLISFECKEKRWNILSLKKHCRNKEEVDWDEVFEFSEQFFHQYYEAHTLIEIDILAILSLLVKYFHLELDCPVEVCSHEILCYLDPKPIQGISDFLSYLDFCHIPYYILSNTVYPSEDTMALIQRLIPDHHFGFFLGSKEVGVKKPNPLFFQTGLRMAYKTPENSAYIGDAFLQDVYGSNQAHFALSVWLNHKGKKKSAYGLSEEIVHNTSCLEVSSYAELLSKWKENEGL